MNSIVEWLIAIPRCPLTRHQTLADPARGEGASRESMFECAAFHGYVLGWECCHVS
jgi:hypothetical protein